MSSIRRTLLIVIVGIFFIGTGIIVYKGRPVEKLQQEEKVAFVDDGENEKESVKEDFGYTLAIVNTHATTESCWTAIGGNVYDLTTWVSRHPGGADRIVALCGIDSTSMFDRVHGKSEKAQAALVLLKIGTLQN